MRVKLTVLNIKRRALSLIPEDGIFISEGDVFGGYVDPKFEYLNLHYVDIEKHDPTNFTAFGKILSCEEQGNSFIYTTKFGKFVLEEVSNGRNETMGHCH